MKTKAKSVAALLRAIRQMPEDQPVENPKKWYLTQKEHWIGWLSEYHGPGAYDRKAHSGRDAEFAYNHIVEPKMLVYLASAAGVEARRVREIKRIDQGPGTLMQKAGSIRQCVPWGAIEQALWPDRRAH